MRRWFGRFGGLRTAYAALLGEFVLLDADELLLAGVGGHLHGVGLLAAGHLRQEDVDGLGHRRRLGRRGVGTHLQSGVERRAQRTLAEDGDGGQLLGAEFLDERLDVRRRVECQQTDLRRVELAQGRSLRTGQNDRVERQLELGQRLGQFGLVGLAQREQELLFLVLDDELDERGERTVAERDFPLAVDDVFLQIERHGLRLADVFHGFGHGDTGLFADVEEAVDGGARGEDDGRMVENLDTLAAELLQRDADDADKRFVFDGDVVLPGEFVEWGLLDDCRTRLRY